MHGRNDVKEMDRLQEKLTSLTERQNDPKQAEWEQHLQKLLDEKEKIMGAGFSHDALDSTWKLGTLTVTCVMCWFRWRSTNCSKLTAGDTTAKKSARFALVTLASAAGLALILVGGAAIMILHDLRARRHAEEEMHDARQAAETANRAKSAFLANMSHELRTPLTVIMGYTDLLASPVGGPEEEEERRGKYLLTLRRSGEHLLTIINDILDLSKIEAGRMEVEVIDCRLMDVFADVDSLMRPRAITKGIHFSVDYASVVPDRVMTDPTRLRQVLVNLVSNAVKFTEHGAVRIVVRYEGEGKRIGEGASGRRGEWCW